MKVILWKYAIYAMVPGCQLEKALIVARTVGIEIGDLKTAQPSLTAMEYDLGFLPTFGDGR